MAPPFVELCARSNFSFLEGASHPEELVAAAHTLGLSAIGIADRHGLYGLVRAHREAKRLGMKLVAGATLVCADEGAASPTEIVLLVRDLEGYRHLCRLLTRAHACAPKGEALLDPSELAACAGGLELVVPLAPAWLAKLARPASGRSIDARALHPSAWGPSWIAALDAFAGRTSIAAHRALDGLDALRTELARALALAVGAPVLATTRPRMHDPARRPLADVLDCLREKTTLSRAGRLLDGNAEARLRSAAQMRALFRDEPAWLERTAEIAARCTFSFDALRYRFPSEHGCLPGESPDAALRRLTWSGLTARYPEGPSAAVIAQCERELGLIARLEVAPYFLSVREVVEMARRRRILCQGRGSAANSAVCFALGVTAVDPARSNLLFERFLSAERAEPPDIDVDFEHERREEVIQEIYSTYGRDRAAMVSEIIAYRGRSALREVSRAFDLPVDVQDRLSGVVLHRDVRDADAKALREAGLDPDDARLAHVLATARALDGFPRHLSIHVGGFVLSSEPLEAVAPIEPARMEGRTVIPWDKDDLDTLGFFKIDVLGLGMLTAIRKTLALLWERGLAPGQRPGEPFDPIEALARIPPEDVATYDAICRADTIGVFQIESRAQMSMLPRLKPRRFYDLVIEVAIVRPGPIQGGMVHPYLRRREGKEPAVSPHPILEPILARTLGVPLFQEQVMQLAMVGAGYGAGEADQLRRDMAAWKKHGRLEQHRERLLAGFARHGIATEFGEALYRQIQGFGEYGFPESHAASFALLVYASSWLKTHHPGPFACALLNAQPMGFYSPSTIVQDAQRHGVVVRPPCVVMSEWHNRLEADEALDDEPASRGGYALRLGFRQVKGLGEAAGLRIDEARRERLFDGVHDLARRAELDRGELEALAEAGALEVLVPGRRNALFRVHAPRLGGLFAQVELERGQRPARLPRLPKVEQLLLDYGRMGLSVSDHPLAHLRAELDLRRVNTARALATIAHGARVRVAGLVTGRQRPVTASGITFMSLEDETGLVNLVVVLPVFERHRHTLLHARILYAEGRLERAGEVVHVKVDDAEPLAMAGGRSIAVRSRDFH